MAGNLTQMNLDSIAVLRGLTGGLRIRSSEWTSASSVLLAVARGWHGDQRGYLPGIIAAMSFLTQLYNVT